jgi:hypothetical protein
MDICQEKSGNPGHTPAYLLTLFNSGKSVRFKKHPLRARTTETEFKSPEIDRLFHTVKIYHHCSPPFPQKGKKYYLGTVLILGLGRHQKAPKLEPSAFRLMDATKM